MALSDDNQISSGWNEKKPRACSISFPLDDLGSYRYSIVGRDVCNALDCVYVRINGGTGLVLEFESGT